MNESDLLSIKQFSEFSGIKQSVLRYYDEINLFNPVHRGENGYRYYSPQQLITVKHINVLNALNTTLKDIGDMSKNRTPQGILNLLHKQECKFDEEMRRLQIAYSITHIFRGLIQTGISATENEMLVCKMEKMSIDLGPYNAFGDNKLFYETFIDFCKVSKNMKINLSYPVGGYFEGIEDFEKNPSQPTRFFSIDPTGDSEKEEGDYLVGYTRGYYGDMGDVPQKFKDYADEHDLIFNGPIYVIYLLDEMSIRESKQYLAQVSVPVKYKKKKIEK